VGWFVIRRKNPASHNEITFHHLMPPSHFLIRWTTSLILVGTFSVSTLRAENLTIEKGGLPWQIFIETSAPDSVRTAAADLQHYVKAVSEVELPIVSELEPSRKWVIYLGDTAFAREQGISTDKLPPDGFRVLTGDSWVVIAGRDYQGPPLVGTENPYRLNETYNPRVKVSAFGDAGTQQGVYWFLRTFAEIRWYMPGHLGEVVPTRSKIVIAPTDKEKAPTFEYRYPYFCFFSASDDMALWYRRAGFGAPFPVVINHSFQLFLKYKESHPEYFALIDGQRDFTTLSTLVGPGNLNLSEPGLIKQAIADINEFFDKNPKEQFFSLVPPDGMQRISEDPESQSQIDESRGEGGRFSNYVWGFINKVALGVYEKHPDKFIGSIAYEKYSLPPTNIEKMSPNVVVMICKPLRRAMPDPKIEASIRTRIDDWSEKVENIYCWEYYCDVLFNAGWRGYPVLYPPKNIQKDLLFLEGKSKGEMIEAETWTEDQYPSAKNPSDAKIVLNDPGLQHLRLYVTSQLLWDPHLDLTEMLDEYYRLFYGSAKKEMKAFWELAAEAWEKKGSPDPASVYPPGVVGKLLDHLEKAREATTAGSIYRQRVDLLIEEFAPAAAKTSRLKELSLRTASIPLTTESKPVDGVLANSFWTDIPPLSLINNSYSLGVPATHVRLMWTPQALSVAIICYEPKMADLNAIVTQENHTPESPVWADDSVELFVQPTDGKTYQLIVNSHGVVYEAKHDPSEPNSYDNHWTSKASIAVKKENSSWTVEMKIPWSSLGIDTAREGLEFRSNIYRSRYAGGELQYFSWAPIISGSFFAPEEFGLMTLTSSFKD